MTSQDLVQMGRYKDVLEHRMPPQDICRTISGQIKSQTCTKNVPSAISDCLFKVGCQEISFRMQGKTHTYFQTMFPPHWYSFRIFESR